MCILRATRYLLAVGFGAMLNLELESRLLSGGSDCGNRAGYYGRVHFIVVLQRGVCIAVQFSATLSLEPVAFLTSAF
jgi:hypothetical protein